MATADRSRIHLAGSVEFRGKTYVYLIDRHGTYDVLCNGEEIVVGPELRAAIDKHVKEKRP